jgi:hypothetical protein
MYWLVHYHPQNLHCHCLNLSNVFQKSLIFKLSIVCCSDNTVTLFLLLQAVTALFISKTAKFISVLRQPYIQYMKAKIHYKMFFLGMNEQCHTRPVMT